MNKEGYLPVVWPALGLLFILPFTHTVAIRLILLVTLLILVVIYRRDLGLRRLPCWQSLAIWAVVPLALLPFAVDPRYSIGEIKSEILYGIVGFYVFAAATRNERYLRLMLISIMLSASVMSLWGLYDYWLHGAWYPHLGLHGGKASFISYTITILPLFFLSWFMLPRWRWLISLLVVLVVYASVAAAQRAFFPAFLGEILVLFGVLGGVVILRQWRVLFLLVAAVGVLVLGFYGFAVRHGQNFDLIHVLMNDPRMVMFKDAVGMFKDNFWTGVGFGQESIKMIGAGRPASHLVHAHNVILNYMIGMGVWGALALFALFGGMSLRYINYIRCEKYALSIVGVVGLAILVGVFLRNQFNDMFVNELSLLFFCVNGMLMGYAARWAQKEKV